MKNFRARFLLAMIVAFIALLCAGVVSYRETTMHQETWRWVSHTHLVLQRLASLRGRIQATERDQRIFLLSRSETYRASYEQGIRGAQTELENLLRLTADNPAQQEVLRDMNLSLAELESDLKQEAERRNANTAVAAALARADTPRNASLAKIEGLIGRMEQQETYLLQQRSAEESRTATRVKAAIVVANTIALFLVAMSVFMLYIHMRRAEASELARKKAEKKFRGLLETAPDATLVVNSRGKIALVNAQAERVFGYSRQELLGEPVEILLPERFRGNHTGFRSSFSANPRVREMGAGLELFAKRKDGSEFPVEVSLSPLETEEGVLVSSSIRDISERKRSQDNIRRLNEELEARNTELVGMNKELESFSYSVSHDLRAPLRAIEGFSLALLEDYFGKLDAEGKSHLQRVRAATIRMGNLIDDMLKLARIARLEPALDDVNLSMLAEEIAAQLMLQEPERKAQIDVTPGLVVIGDRNLLRAMLENLLGNAWKFTSKCPVSHIEIGATNRDAERVFFVRDNGAGFDMRYADKLFGVFQRLHSDRDYPGTGVGLASVQRIIHKHGGRIWAESAVGQGATFNFVLQPKARMAHAS